jgi:hypothetical protein
MTPAAAAKLLASTRPQQGAEGRYQWEEKVAEYVRHYRKQRESFDVERFLAKAGIELDPVTGWTTDHISFGSLLNVSPE